MIVTSCGVVSRPDSSQLVEAIRFNLVHYFSGVIGVDIGNDLRVEIS